MPARRRKKHVRTPSRMHIKWQYFLPLLIIPIIVGIFFLKKIIPHYWSSTYVTHVVYPGSDGSVKLLIADPTANSMTVITVPANTQVPVARNLGNLRLKNVWTLGEQQKIGGKLLAETVVKSLHFPTFLYADSKFDRITSLTPWSLFSFAFSPSETNLSVGDRFRMGLFALRVTKTNIEYVDLAKYSFLKKQQLVDGDDGYVIATKLPVELQALFSFPEIAAEGKTFEIVNKTGDLAISEEIGEVVSSMGAKIAVVTNTDTSGEDCEVDGKNSKTVVLMARIFSCAVGKSNKDSNIDIRLTIGTKFLSRF